MNILILMELINHEEMQKIIFAICWNSNAIL